MPTYTVHQPPPRKGEAASAPERFVFVRDGFHFWAFLLGPLWMLRLPAVARRSCSIVAVAAALEVALAVRRRRRDGASSSSGCCSRC